MNTPDADFRTTDNTPRNQDQLQYPSSQNIFVIREGCLYTCSSSGSNAYVSFIRFQERMSRVSTQGILAEAVKDFIKICAASIKSHALENEQERFTTWTRFNSTIECRNFWYDADCVSEHKSYYWSPQRVPSLFTSFSL